jgi:DNA-binding NarL/FixJ family response regulator
MSFSILLVEDNNAFRQTLADTLQAHFGAANIAQAGDASSALRELEGLRPGIIFMDISLPGENGLELTRKMKMRCEHTPIVILTSYDLPEYREQAFRNGADHFICKSDDSCLADVVACVAKARSDKNSGSPQQNRSASDQRSWPWRVSKTTVFRLSAGVGLVPGLP